MILHRRSKEVMRVRVERDMEDLGTVWDIFREVQDLVRYQLPVGYIVKKGPSTIPSNGTHFPGGNRHRIDLRTKQNSILLYFTLSVV